MATLTIRIRDDTAARRRTFARHRGITLQQVDGKDFSATGLAEFDTETRFRLRAARGVPKRGLAILAELDARLGKKPPRRGSRPTGG